MKTRAQYLEEQTKKRRKGVVLECYQDKQEAAVKLSSGSVQIVPLDCLEPGQRVWVSFHLDTTQGGYWTAKKATP